MPVYRPQLDTRSVTDMIRPYVLFKFIVVCLLEIDSYTATAVQYSGPTRLVGFLLYYYLVVLFWYPQYGRTVCAIRDTGYSCTGIPVVYTSRNS